MYLKCYHDDNINSDPHFYNDRIIHPDQHIHVNNDPVNNVHKRGHNNINGNGNRPLNLRLGIKRHSRSSGIGCCPAPTENYITKTEVKREVGAILPAPVGWKDKLLREKSLNKSDYCYWYRDMYSTHCDFLLYWHNELNKSTR